MPRSLNASRVMATALLGITLHTHTSRMPKSLNTSRAAVTALVHGKGSESNTKAQAAIFFPMPEFSFRVERRAALSFAAPIVHKEIFLGKDGCTPVSSEECAPSLNG